MKIIIIYGSKYGATKEVAEMISKQIKEAEIVDVNNFDGEVERYDYVILGSNTTAGLMNKKIKQVYNRINLEKQKVTVFISGLQKESLSTVIEQNLSKDVISNSYFVGGKLNFMKMNIFEKTIIKAINKKAEFIELTNSKKVYDLLDYQSIDTMIEDIKGIY